MISILGDLLDDAARFVLAANPDGRLSLVVVRSSEDEKTAVDRNHIPVSDPFCGGNLRVTSDEIVLSGSSMNYGGGDAVSVQRIFELAGTPLTTEVEGRKFAIRTSGAGNRRVAQVLDRLQQPTPTT